MTQTRTIISGTGSVIPDLLIPNSNFENNEFYDKDGNALGKTGAEVAAKLEAISGIRERRYLPFEQDSVQLMTEASRRAVEDCGLDINQLDGIIVAHNAGNMIPDSGGSFHTVPNMAAALKHELGSTNPNCFAYDILFGCPGWLQAIVQAHQAIKSGDTQHVLVTGLEVASRLLDPHDPDSMLLGDGCGAAVISRSEDGDAGLIAHTTFSHALDDHRIIYLGPSHKPGVEGSCFFHMNGRAVYKYATEWVPKVIASALEKAKLKIQEIDLFLFHQANAKMLEAIAANLAALCEIDLASLQDKIPTTIQFLGNTSVATIPTMLDLIRKNELDGYAVRSGDVAVMASVGAGMHCNALVYRF